MLIARTDTSGVAGHPLWHLLALVVLPPAIIAAFTFHDRVRDNRARRLQALGPKSGRGFGPAQTELKLVVLASACAALIHGAVCPEHLREQTSFGVFFLVLCAIQLGWSVAVVRHPGAGLLRLGAVSSLLVVALWLYTRTIGLPLGLENGVVEPFGVPDLVASALEIVVAGLALHLSRGETGPPVPAFLTPGK